MSFFFSFSQTRVSSASLILFTTQSRFKLAVRARNDASQDEIVRIQLFSHPLYLFVIL